MQIEKLVRDNIRKLSPYISARKQESEGILLDANENSLGSVADGETDNLNRYPDPNHSALRKAIGGYYHVKPENIAVGVGSDELIDLLVRIFCEPGRDSVIIPEPTYGMYQVICDTHNIGTRQVLLDRDFQIDPVKILALADSSVKMIFLCSPNNPTGNLLRESDIEQLAEGFSGIVVVDEAYGDFTGERKYGSSKNIVKLRTFSKAWGLAGVRCGIAIADDSVIDYIYRVKMPYNINLLTEKVVLKALRNSAKKKKMVHILVAERKRLEDALHKITGVKRVFPSDANFLLIQCDRSGNLFDFLKSKGIIVRDRSRQPLLEDCLRVTVGTLEQNDLFIEKTKEFYA